MEKFKQLIAIILGLIIVYVVGMLFLAVLGALFSALFTITIVGAIAYVIFKAMNGKE